MRYSPRSGKFCEIYNLPFDISNVSDSKITTILKISRFTNRSYFCIPSCIFFYTILQHFSLQEGTKTYFFVPVWVPKGTRFDLPLRQRVPKSTRGKLPGTKKFHNGNATTELIEVFLDSKATFFKQKIQNNAPEFKIFALRALSHDHDDISVSIKQLVKLLQENRREAAKILWGAF